MTFKCTIPGVSLKVFGRAIQSLSKIGDELYFEPQEDGLYLRSVNSCRSAYGCFQFFPSFFLHYVDVSSQVDTQGEEDGFRCKIGMKSVMTVFRNLSTIDKTVEKCRISLSTSEDRLVFQMYCRHGIIKTHKLAFIECETLQAVSSKELCPNKITSLPKLLCEVVVNFQANQDEISLIVRPDFLAFQNYVDDEQDPAKVMRTEMTLSPGEFDQYQVGVDTDITFCLKELRAILAFADITNLPVTLQFESAGRPITFSITGDLSYEATFVLATLAEADSSQAPAPSQGQGQRNNQASRDSRTHADTSTRINGHANKEARAGQHLMRPKQRAQTSRARNNGEGEEQREEDNGMSATMMVEDVSIMNPISYVNNNTINRTNSARIRDRHQFGEGRLNCDTGHREDGHSNGGETEEQDHHNRTNSFRREENACEANNNTTGALHTDEVERYQSNKGLLEDQMVMDLGSPVIPLQNDNNSAANIEDDQEEEELPATPPSKKFRSVFFGTQSSTQPSQSQRQSQILAPASDEED